MSSHPGAFQVTLNGKPCTAVRFSINGGARLPIHGKILLPALPDEPIATWAYRATAKAAIQRTARACQAIRASVVYDWPKFRELLDPAAQWQIVRA